MKLLLLFALAACVDPAVDATVHDLGTCGVVTEYPILDSPHLPIGSPIEWPSNPPTSGPHWPLWAGWNRVYDSLERAFWLHNAEHGGVVLASRDCDDCTMLLADVVRQLPPDPHCEPPLRTRTLVVADPQLPDGTRVAAIAWGVAYTADCVDLEALHAFIAEHYGRATENSCADGLGGGGVAIE